MAAQCVTLKRYKVVKSWLDDVLCQTLPATSGPQVLKDHRS